MTQQNKPNTNTPEKTAKPAPGPGDKQPNKQVNNDNDTPLDPNSPEKNIQIDDNPDETQKKIPH